MKIKGKITFCTWPKKRSKSPGASYTKYIHWGHSTTRRVFETTENSTCWESARQGTSRLRRLSAWSSTLCCLCSWVRAGYLLVWAQAIKRARSSSHARLELCGEALKSTKLNIAQVFLFGYTSTRLTTTFIWGQKPDYGLQKCRQNFTKLCNLTDIQVETSNEEIYRM